MLVDGAKCGGDDKVEKVELRGAECVGYHGESSKGKDEISSVEGASVECCGVEVEMGEKDKGGVGVEPIGDGGNVSVECGKIKQMSREKLRRIGQHQSGSKGECGVVLLCLIIVVV